MPQVTLMGHPLHPQLIVMPAALLPFSLILDALHAGTRNVWANICSERDEMV